MYRRRTNNNGYNNIIIIVYSRRHTDTHIGAHINQWFSNVSESEKRTQTNLHTATNTSRQRWSIKSHDTLHAKKI